MARAKAKDETLFTSTEFLGLGGSTSSFLHEEGQPSHHILIVTL